MSTPNTTKLLTLKPVVQKYPHPEELGTKALPFRATQEGEFMGQRFSPIGLAGHPTWIDLEEIYRRCVRLEIAPPKDSTIPLWEGGEPKPIEEILAAVVHALRPIKGFPKAQALFDKAWDIREEWNKNPKPKKNVMVRAKPTRPVSEEEVPVQPDETEEAAIVVTTGAAGFEDEAPKKSVKGKKHVRS